MSDLNVIIATDCGSTTTKAILIERQGEEYRQTYRGEAPTTVEAPFEDVTRGVLNAIAELEDLSGRKLLEDDHIITPAQDGAGADVYVSTSSAGGGLQMLVAGVVQSMSAESARRAALGAGAIVMDAIAINDRRLPHEKIELIRHLRPDMILLSGGTDGGTVSHVVELAEYIAAARPRPRLGHTFRLPVIYAGNKAARDEVAQALADKADPTVTDNIRPTLEREHLRPAREKIHDLFMEHVMAQAPGYPKLMDWVSAPIMPTPSAVGNIMQSVAKQHGINIVGVDIGGATTDVFSVFDGMFNRSVSANLGMSYSVSNVLAEAGLANIMRWVPFDMDERDLHNRIKNKMIRPTTIPHVLEELKIEQAIAREALRLAFHQHKTLAVGLKGVRQERTIADAFDQVATGESLIDIRRLDMLIGSGGVLSHAPRREQAAMMLVDAFQPEGVTRLAVDSIFMMPHLGVLATVHEQAATQVFEKDCMVVLGECIAASGAAKPGKPCLSYHIKPSQAEAIEGELAFGEIALHPLQDDAGATVDVSPARGFDMGEGKGQPLHATVHGGVVGVIIDARGRPLTVPQTDRASVVANWASALEAYPA